MTQGIDIAHVSRDYSRLSGRDSDPARPSKFNLPNAPRQVNADRQNARNSMPDGFHRDVVEGNTVKYDSDFALQFSGRLFAYGSDPVRKNLYLRCLLAPITWRASTRCRGVSIENFKGLSMHGRIPYPRI